MKTFDHFMCSLRYNFVENIISLDINKNRYPRALSIQWPACRTGQTQIVFICINGKIWSMFLKYLAKMASF